VSVKNQPVKLPENLSAAIACLDLSLESELALYRNHRSQASSMLALSSADPDEAALRSPDLALEAFIATDDPRMLSAEEDNTNDNPDAEVREIEPITAAIEIEEESETLPEPYGAELAAQPKALDQFLDPSIEAYLESSEALLKHLDEPAGTNSAPAQEPAPSSKNSRQSWVVGSGIVLIILGMLALAGFFVFVAQQWLSTKSSIAPVKPQPLVPPTQSVPSPSVSPLPNQSRSTLPNTAIASRAVTRQESATEGIPSKLIETGAGTPQPSAAPSPSINPNAANYVVLAANSSAQTFQKAQRLVPDAFVTNVGGQRRIQLGSLDSLQQAQQMVNELKNQGLPASIMAQN
jgi:hypothetical protein